MASTISYGARNIGTTTATVFTAGSGLQTVVNGLTLANVTTASITASAMITRGGVDYYVVKDAGIPVGSSLCLVGGEQKLCMVAGDLLRVSASTATSVDCLASALVVGGGAVGGGGGGSPVGPTNFNILLVSADTTAWVTTVKNAMLASTSSYASYNFNITVTGGVSAIPTLTVGQYDAVFFWGDGGLAWSSSLETVKNAGTGLITGVFFPSVSGVVQGVMPVNSANLDQPTATWTWPSGNTHPISIGDGSAGQAVSPLVYSGFRSSTYILQPGATTPVLDGSILLAAVIDNAAPAGRTVYLNMFPPSNAAGGYSGGWNDATYRVAMGRMFLNTCLWSARKI